MKTKPAPMSFISYYPAIVSMMIFFLFPFSFQFLIFLCFPFSVELKFCQTLLPFGACCLMFSFKNATQAHYKSFFFVFLNRGCIKFSTLLFLLYTLIILTFHPRYVFPLLPTLRKYKIIRTNSQSTGRTMPTIILPMYVLCANTVRRCKLHSVCYLIGVIGWR